MAQDKVIPIFFTGGMNNRDTPLSLFLGEKGETVNLINADTTYGGRLKLLRPLKAINLTAIGSSIHTIYRAHDWTFVGASTKLYYMDATDESVSSLTSLLTGLSGNAISLHHAGNWVYLGDGTNKYTIYIGGSTPVVCDWGQDVPTAGPTVAVGAAGNPNDTYSCYYRYRITLPDGTIILTDLSPVASITVASQKIEWSNLVHASFTGATSNQIDLFRTASGWAAKYLVATIDEGTTTYSDDVDDTTLKSQTAFAEDGYYPPPDGPELLFYHPGADRMFLIIDNKAYWTEAGLYHTVVYSTLAAAYTNVNAVFLAGEDITGIGMIDEQAYFGSKRTWRRLRGKNPSYWTWEDTSAIKGPISWQSVAKTLMGLIYPGSDGYLYIFQGIDSQKIAVNFVFDTEPTVSSIAAFDGRFYYLFYADSTYPELRLDFLNTPALAPRVVKSTRSYSACHYNSDNHVLYMGDSSGFLRTGEDTDQEVALTVLFSEIPIERIVDFGNMAGLIIDAKTGDDDLTITPYQDDDAKSPLTAIKLTARGRKAVPVRLNEYRAASFGVTITSKEDIELREPWILRKEDG